MFKTIMFSHLCLNCPLMRMKYPSLSLKQNYSDWVEVKSQGSFNLYFTDNQE